MIKKTMSLIGVTSLLIACGANEHGPSFINSGNSVVQSNTGTSGNNSSQLTPNTNPPKTHNDQGIEGRKPPIKDLNDINIANHQINVGEIPIFDPLLPSKYKESYQFDPNNPKNPKKISNPPANQRGNLTASLNETGRAGDKTYTINITHGDPLNNEIYSYDVKANRGTISNSDYSTILAKQDDLEHSIYGMIARDNPDYDPFTQENFAAEELGSVIQRTDWDGFAAGNPTNDMTGLSGKVTYRGNAIGMHDNRQLGSDTIDHGEFYLDVDFGAGKVSGKITGGTTETTVLSIDDEKVNFGYPILGFGRDGITLEGDIRDNYFEGSAKLNNYDPRYYDENRATADMYGQFNGSQAEEVSGYYKSNVSGGISGAFGGKQ